MGDHALPEEGYYFLVEHHVWARPEDRSSDADPQVVRVGVTDAFQALAHRIMFFTPRRLGRDVEQGDPIAVLETGKWLGTIPSAVTGQIVTFNPKLIDDPSLLNSDPYGEGWVALLRTTEPDLERQGLVTGAEGVAFYLDLLETAGIRSPARATRD